MASESDTYFHLRKLHAIFAASAIALAAASFWMLAIDRQRPEPIEQIVLPDLKIDYHFCQVPRCDRCTTCHSTLEHPGRNLFVADASPHPVGDFGCTVCHEGQGSATDFAWASHSPNSASQAAEWKRDREWHENPDWERPMFAARFTESGCLRCHPDVTDLETCRKYDDPPAPKLSAGYQAVRQYGCFGCHAVPGFEAARRVGPRLVGLDRRVSDAFLRNWIAAPSRFRAQSRMPQLFGLNDHLDKDAKKEVERREWEEIRSIAAYLQSIPMPEVAAASGDAGQGAKLFEKRGCLACHQNKEFQRAKSAEAVDLSNLGKKYATAAGRTWLAAWIRDPAVLSPRTRMPNPLLPASEANAIAAWLVQGEPVRAESICSGSIEAGKAAIRRRGCFGCHEIPGFENEQRIGPELADWGRKPIAQLGLERGGRREDFAWQKLSRPRSFDGRKSMAYEERLRMGRFAIPLGQRESIVTFLLGLTAEPMAERYISRPQGARRAVVEGRKLIDHYGCGRCHALEMERWTIDHAEVVGTPRLDSQGRWKTEEDDNGNDLYSFMLWEPARWQGKTWPVGGADLLIEKWKKRRPAVGGDAVGWLYPSAIGELKSLGAAAPGSEAWTWLPPSLAYEGRRARPDWTFDFLKSPRVIRPGAIVRMPRFGLSDNEASRLAEYFAAAAGTEFPFILRQYKAPSEKMERMAQVGGAMAVLEDKNFCGKCHQIGGKGGLGTIGVVGPDLEGVARRIRPEYLREWLANPRSKIPYTPMPEFFPSSGGVIPQDLMRGTTAEQLDAMADLLLNWDWYRSRRP